MSITEEGRETLYYFGSVVDPKYSGDKEYLLPWMNNNQLSIIEGLIEEGFGKAISFAPVPFPTFPKGKRLLVKGRKSVYRNNIRIINVPYVNIPIAKQFSIAAENSVNIYKEVKKDSPAIFLLFNPRIYQSIATLFFSRILRAPLFIIVADFEYHKWIKFWKKPMLFLEILTSEYVMRRSNGLICYSKWTAEDLQYKKKWLKMEGAINEELLNEERNVDAGLKIVMFSGSLNEVGGIGLLLEAFRLLNEPEYRFWITGKGYREEEVIEAKRLDDRIQYFGFLENRELREIQSKATVLINPRLSAFPENRYNFPGKLLDYLASGRPVITTATGDVCDEYGDKAFILREETPQALADLIREVCSMPQEELEVKCEGVRRYMLENKTWKVQCSRMYEFIMENLEGRGL
jgi:glycosyltransferase involved in cell wall biosynthesis